MSPVVRQGAAAHGGRFPTASLDYIQQRSLDESYDLAGFELSEGFARAVAAGVGAQADMVKAFALALERLTSSSKSQIANTHHQLGEVMQKATVRAYLRARVTKGRNIAPYREATRDAGGRLERALRSSEFFRGTHDGIGFVNTRLLDSEARQWHRLNFGAGAAAGGPSRRTPLRWQGMVVGAIGFDESPSAPFSLPRGFWTEGGRSGAFRPSPRPNPPRRPTRGIAAWHFFEAGTEVLGREIGPAYERLYTRWFDSARRSVGPLSRVLQVQASIPAPRRGGFAISAR